MHPSQSKLKYLSFLPEYLYGNLAYEHYEILTIGSIKPADLKVEAGLMQKKWFDYRLMHPLQATYYFFHLYTEAYKNFWRQYIDADRAPYIKPMRKTVDFLDSRQEKGTIWRLRQMVDSCGMRYEFFFKSAFKHQYKMIANGRVVPPRPSMLKNEELFEKVLLDWEATCSATLQYACSPYYKSANYHNSSMQRSYEDYIIKNIKRKRLPEYALSYCLFEHGCLRIERALLEFDIRIIDDAFAQSSAV